MNLKKLMKKALSNFDLYKFFDNKIKIYTYNELTKYKTIEDAFYPYNIMFILYETKDLFGHWVVLCQNKHDIYFFDPYGFFPDEQLKFTNKVFRKYNNMSLPHLTTLLLKSDKNIHYNDHELQNINNKSLATCGRWVLIFALLYNYITIDEFARYFKTRKMKPDEYITLLTHYL